MKTQITQQQIESYRENGFLVIEDFLDKQELAFWRGAVTEAGLIPMPNITGRYLIKC
jgi:phytanoyl-CoA hydroxylase